MDNDDQPVGRLLTRREILTLFSGASGALLLAGCAPVATTGGQAANNLVLPTVTPAVTSAVATGAPLAAAATAALPTCVVRPAQTEGPYFVDEMLNRSDVRSDPGTGEVRPGVPLALRFAVSQIGNNACTPLAGAMVDIWHCDARGVYSDVNDRSGGTVGQKFLRGYQVTDANGAAQFTTIYPGWYPGRAVHIHFKIRTDNSSGQGHEFTSQLYFDDTFSDQIFTQEPYAPRDGARTRNAQDGIFQNGGDQLTLNVVPEGNGYAATFEIGLQLG